MRKRWLYILMAVMAMTGLAGTLALPVAASTGETDLPPLPEWPIIGPILRWLGIAPEEQVTPDSARVTVPEESDLPEQRITNVAEARALWEALETGEEVRVLIADEDINAVLAQEIEDVPGFNSATLNTETDKTTLSISAERALLEKVGGDLAVVIAGQNPEGTLTLAMTAANCRPVITVTRIRINGRRLAIEDTVQALIDKAFDKGWREKSWLDNQVCIEAVYLTPGEIAMEGYRK